MIQTSGRLHNNAQAALDSLGNDLLIRCASYLDAVGLVQLGRASARLGIPRAGQERSLVNEAAHQQLKTATDGERDCLPKHDDESDIALYRALKLLRQPLCFDVLVGGGFRIQETSAKVAFVSSNGINDCSAAMSEHVMRGGRHRVEFAITSHEHDRKFILLGVIRPVSLTNGIDLRDWDGCSGRRVTPAMISSHYKPAAAEKLRSQRTAKWGDSDVHCCAYLCENGQCDWTDWDNARRQNLNWQGNEGLGSSGAVGLLLDLDEGTLSVFKDGRRLGVMKDGLDGEYCWFVTAYSGCEVSILKGKAPK